MGAPPPELSAFVRRIWPYIQPLNPEWEGKSWDQLDEKDQDYWLLILDIMPGLVLHDVLPIGLEILRQHGRDG